MTQRTLLILRHAKAERPSGVPDLDRPLTERGHADAAAAGAWLAAKGHRPDLVICSPARRTRQTWHGVSVALATPAPPEVRLESMVYEARASDLLDLIHGVSPEVHTLLVIGHNPTVSLLSVALDPGGVPDSDGLRTSGLAVHSVTGTWDALIPGAAPLVCTHTARAG
jgi:phosphohistidine phosphatase